MEESKNDLSLFITGSDSNKYTKNLVGLKVTVLNITRKNQPCKLLHKKIKHHIIFREV